MIDEVRSDTTARGDNPFVVWGKALLDDPNATLEDLLSGAGTRGTQQHAEPADFLADLIEHSVHESSKDRLLARLDTAVLEWLKNRRTWRPSMIVESGTRAYLTQVANGLEIVARMPLEVTASEMIRTHYTWDDWFLGLRLSGDIDLLRQFDMVLIQHQTDGRFTRRWFAACDEAAWGGPYWHTRLRTGLLGLRKIPAAEEARPEMSVATALVRFSVLALSRKMHHAQVETAVRRQAGALALLYPRHTGHWQNVWADALDLQRRSSREDTTSLANVATWLGHAEATDSRATRGSSHPVSSGNRTALPDKQRLQQIEIEISATDTVEIELWNTIQRLVDDHWRYAIESGDSYYAVRTTVNLCNQALSHSLGKPYVEKINEWALQTIEMEPYNPFGWDLWAKTLTVLRHDEIATAVRWESIRRFPANVVLHSSLAQLLVNQGKLVLAESLLRESIKDFPHNVAIRDILARVLWKQGRHEEVINQTVMLRKLDPDIPHFTASHSRGFVPRVPRPAIRDPVFSQRDPDGFVTAYVTQLKDRTRWTELFFAPSVNGDSIKLDTLLQGSRTSESALVVAHRAGLMDRSDHLAELRNWASVRPSSYSARLLLALHKIDGLDTTAMRKISDDFPQHRRWNQWLCYGFATRDERNQLRLEEQGSSPLNSWVDRLLAVYPGLRNGKEDGAASIDAVNQRRLAEEFAFAAAETAVPSFALTA